MLLSNFCYGIIIGTQVQRATTMIICLVCVIPTFVLELSSISPRTLSCTSSCTQSHTSQTVSHHKLYEEPVSTTQCICMLSPSDNSPIPAYIQPVCSSCHGLWQQTVRLTMSNSSYFCCFKVVFVSLCKLFLCVLRCCTLFTSHSHWSQVSCTPVSRIFHNKTLAWASHQHPPPLALTRL